MTLSKFRRIVTGHNDQGRAVILSDGRPERIAPRGTAGVVFYEIWNTRETPHQLDRASGEPAEADYILKPPPGGTRIRMVDFPPNGTPTGNIHRTETIDYGIVMEGEIWCVVDEGEVLCRPGDVVVQRGTNHGWSNRSDNVCRMIFVLIDAEFTDGLEGMGDFVGSEGERWPAGIEKG